MTYLNQYKFPSKRAKTGGFEFFLIFEFSSPYVCLPFVFQIPCCVPVCVRVVNWNVFVFVFVFVFAFVFVLVFVFVFVFVHVFVIVIVFDNDNDIDKCQ